MSNRFKASAVLLLAMTMAAPVVAQAQDARYSPPPMFEDMTPPMVRPEGQDGYIVPPKSSTGAPLPPAASQTPPSVITPRVSVDPNSARAPEPKAAEGMPAPTSGFTQMPANAPPAPPMPPLVTTKPVVAPAPVVPQKPVSPPPQKPKMMDPIVETAPKPSKAEKPAPSRKEASPAPERPKAADLPARVSPKEEEPAKVEPAPQPAPASEPKQIQDLTAPIAPAPVPRDPPESAIKGPKTMPAIPAADVDGEVLFEGKDSAGPTIMERHQESLDQKKKAVDSGASPEPEPAVIEDAKTDKTLTPIVPAPNPNVAPAAFDPGDQGVLKKAIPFTPGQIGLTAADSDPIVAGVVKELDGKDDLRVQIRAFATPHGTGLSSDRRIALSRALSLRSSMIAQGVPAARIDVMAEGLQSDSSRPGDRIDLYIYGPKVQ